MASNYPISLPISVRDAGATQQLTKISGAMDRLTKHTTKLSGAFQNAFQFYVRFRIFGLINQAISSIENAIPSLIEKGREWGNTVDSVADSTGLAAEQASLFAASAKVMTGDTEGLTKALGALAQQTVNHGDVLRRYGIDTKNANGQLLDSWSILQNVRRALADTGNSFITTAAARDLFSRGGQTLMDFLTMSDQGFKMLIRDVKASGVIMSQQGLQIADQWERTRNRLDNQITGVANTLTQALGPSLMRFVDAVTNFIRANLTEIVSFLASVVGAVVHFAAGFLGINLELESFAEKQDKAGKSSERLRGRLSRSAQTRQEQTKTENAHTNAIQKSIDAIDRQIAALGRQERAENARAEQKRLLAEITDAKKELNELRGKAIFAAGMSNREAELARQAQAADIMEAQKKIADARKRLGEHNRKQALEDRRFELEQRKAALQEQMNAQMKAMSQRQQADREALSQALGGGGSIGKLPENIRKAASAAARAFKDQGPDFTTAGESFRTMFDGIVASLGNIWDSLKTEVPKWVDTLSRIGDTLGDVAKGIGEIVDWVSNHNPFGKGEGQVDVDPAAAIIGGAALWKGKGLIAKLLGRGAGALVGGAGAGAGALGGAATSSLGRVIGSGVAKALGPLGLALSAKEIVDQVNSNSKMFEELKSGNLAALDRFLASASSAELEAASANLKNLPGNLGALESTLYGMSSGIIGLDVLLGNAKEHNETLIKKIDAELEARKKEQGSVTSGLQTVASNLTAGGRPAGNYLQTMTNYLQRVAYPRPGFLWGQATTNLYLDKELVLTMAGVPIRQGNSSIRPTRAR